MIFTTTVNYLKESSHIISGKLANAFLILRAFCKFIVCRPNVLWEQETKLRNCAKYLTVTYSPETNESENIF